MSDPVETTRGAVRIFGILQGLVFVVIAVTIYLRWRKEKDQEEALKIKLDQMSFKAGTRREAASGAYTAESQAGKAEQNAEPLQVSSALPNWAKGTPPEQILGISVQAPNEEIEAAYKTLLKKYHPDRFESWGPGYKTRAHYIVLQVQKARDEMLKRRG